MGIALLAVSTLAHPLALLHRWWSRRAPNPAALCQQFPVQTRGSAPRTSMPQASTPAGKEPCQQMAPLRRAETALARTPHSRTSRVARPRLDQPFPLRVHHSHGTGRMAIAGRMADVCAELDRLVASELRH